MKKQLETSVKERPILFSGAMVRALLAGNKMQTRRAIKNQPPPYAGNVICEHFNPAGFDKNGEMRPDPEVFGAYDDAGYWGAVCPYGQPGDRLVVREAWRTLKQYDHLKPSELGAFAPISYEADGLTLNGHWGRYRSARFMMRYQSRLLLEITAVCVERLQDISEADAQAEGAAKGLLLPYGIGDWQLELNQYANYKTGFQYIWYKINGPDSWAANPWVWVVEFRVVASAPVPTIEKGESDER